VETPEGLQQHQSMNQPRTPLYRGSLSPKLAAEVSAAALRNAHRLIEDARVLVSACRYPTAITLAVLAIEEATKAELVRLIVSATKPKVLKEAWQAFRNHAIRQSDFMREVLSVVSANPELVKPDLGPIEEMLTVFKELGLYVDLTPNGEDYDEPARRLGNAAEHAKVFVDIAARFVGGKTAASVRAMELWLEHLGSAQTAGALARWKAAMEAEGLKS